jgi:hypothetical protein
VYVALLSLAGSTGTSALRLQPRRILVLPNPPTPGNVAVDAGGSRPVDECREARR